MPAASAGPDQAVEPGDLVTLDGSASSDDNGTIIAYEWTQTNGDHLVTLSCTDTCPNGISTFSAPAFDDELEFKLTVWDNDNNDDEDYITITVSTPTTIYEIQYTEVQGTDPDCYPSLSADMPVTTSGIVTHKIYEDHDSHGNTFFLQDGNDEWSGIYVYD